MRHINIKRYFINLLDPKLLVMLVIVLALCIVLTMVFGQKTPSFKEKYKSKFYTYLFAFSFVYAVIALLGYNKLFLNDTLYEFIFYQICSLIMGIIHCVFYRSFFNKFDSQKIGSEYLFGLITILYALIPFSLIYTFLNTSDFVFLILGHFIIFFIPTFLNDTFNRAMVIPPKIYKTWQFPENYLDDNGLTEKELKNMVVFTFLMDKNKEARKYSVYRAKGPTRVDFGRLFYNFVLDYNDKHPVDHIQIEDKNGLFNWVFFLQPNWYESTKYIDPDLTLYMNGIEENSVIFCVRTDQIIDDRVEENKDTEYEFTNEGDKKRMNKKEEEKEMINQEQ